MTLYCANSPCETEAAHYYNTDDGLPFCLCGLCADAFELGQVNARKELRGVVELILKRGTQILYIPSHAEGSEYHRDVEQGFVTSVDLDQGIAWCRYWSKHDHTLLRTTSWSETTHIGAIKAKDTRPQELIDQKLKELGYVD